MAYRIVRRDDLAVDVRDINGVGIHDGQRAHASTRKCLNRESAYAAHAEHADMSARQRGNARFAQQQLRAREGVFLCRRCVFLRAHCVCFFLIHVGTVPFVLFLIIA